MREGKIADFGHKKGEGFRKRATDPQPNFSGSTSPGAILPSCQQSKLESLKTVALLVAWPLTAAKNDHTYIITYNDPVKDTQDHG